ADLRTSAVCAIAADPTPASSVSRNSRPAILRCCNPAILQSCHSAIQYHCCVAHSERLPRSTAAIAAPGASKKKGLSPGAWEEARQLVWKHRSRLVLGLGLMVISRVSGLVLPWTTKKLMDDVITLHNWDLLPKLAQWVGAATLVDAACSFANSQILGVAAQRAITDMRKDVEAHVMRLPVRYFDSTKSGILI